MIGVIMIRNRQILNNRKNIKPNKKNIKPNKKNIKPIKKNIRVIGGKKYIIRKKNKPFLYNFRIKLSKYFMNCSINCSKRWGN